MNIAVLTSLFPGPPRPFEGIFAERRWSHMRARGHQVSVTQPLPRTPGPLSLGAWGELRRMPKRELRAGLEITRPRYLHLPGRARRNARLFARVGVKRVLRDARPDVVVCDYAWPAAEAASLFAREGIPCVINGRGSDVLQVAGEAGLGEELARCLRSAGHWCAVSQDLVDAMDALAGMPGQGVLVPNGVDMDEFRIADRAVARETLGLRNRGKLVVVVGHLIERKDPLLALDVFLSGLSGVTGTADDLSDAQCVFLGRGPLESELRARITELGAGDRVRLAGEVGPTLLAAWYTAADLLLLTSRREGRPNVVLEALASGLPVLATEAGGTRELLQSFQEVALSACREPEHLGRMLRALLYDPPAAEELRASIEHLSWAEGLKTLERCLQACIDATPVV